MRALISLFALFPVLTEAALLETTAGTKEIEGVKLATSATYQGRKMEAVGAGLRFKKVVFVKAKVYVGELFLDQPATFVRNAEGALASLDKSKTLAVRMTFLRDVEAEKIQGAFADALKENKIGLEDPAIQKFLHAVKNSGAAKEKKTLTVVAKREGGKELVSYEDSDGKVESIEGGAGFIRQIFSLWFGKPADSGVESLQEDIFKN